MSLVVFGSLKDAPGVTTLLTAVGYQWPRHRRVALIEADIDGGSIAARFGLHPSHPSLVSFAAVSRHQLGEDEFWSACQRLPSGPPALVAPGGPSTVASLEQIDFAALDGTLRDTDLLIDAGRLRNGEQCEGARFTVVVVRPHFEHLAVLLERARELSEARPLLVVVTGEGPYPVYEIDAALRQTSEGRSWVAATVASDAKAAAALAGEVGRDRALRRSQLARTVRPLTDLLAHFCAAGVPAAPEPMVQGAGP